MYRPLPVLFALLLAACASGADGATGTTTPPPPPPPAPNTVASSLVLSANDVRLLVGQPSSLSGIAYNSSGEVIPGKAIQWASSASEVVSISALGIMVATSIGTATITATADGATATANVTVSASNAPVSSIAISIPDDALLIPALNVSLSIILRDGLGNRLTGRSVTTTSSNTAVGTMIGATFRPVAAGTTVITATSEGITTQATFTVREGGLIPVTGGLATAYGGAVKVQVPTGSLTTALQLLINPTMVATFPAGYVPSTGYEAVPESAQLDIAATIKLTYPVAAAGNPANFRLYRWDGTAWIAVPGSTVDVATRTVSGTTKNLGNFAVIETN